MLARDDVQLNSLQQKLYTPAADHLCGCSETWCPSHVYQPVPLLSNLGTINLSGLFWFRWHALNPLQKRLPLPFCKIQPTIGEIMIISLMIAVCVAFSIPLTVRNSGSSGSVANLVLTFTLSTACHNSIWSFLLGLPFERALSWHKLFAYVTIIVAAVHGYAALSDVGLVEGLRINDRGLAQSGFVWELAMGMLWLTSLPPIRRNFFEFFYGSHLLFVTVAILAGFAHSAGFVVGLGLWVIDLVFRGHMASASHPKKMCLSKLPGGIVSLSFEKCGTVHNPAGLSKKNEFHYKPGQYMFVCVKKLSSWEFHPFSISSSPNQKTVSLHIRALGNWTTRLHQLAEKEKEVEVWLEGPYGEPSICVDDERYDVLLLLSGGIGVTPMQSIANELVHQYKQGRPIQKIFFIWSVRDHTMFGGNAVQEEDKKTLHRVNSQMQSFTPMVLEHVNVCPSLVTLPYGGQSSNHTSMEDGRRSSFTTDENNEDVLHCQFHLTRTKSKEDFSQSFSQQEAEQLPNCVYFGRPNMEALFDKVAGFAASRPGQSGGSCNVGVMACGPAKMVEDASNHSRRHKFDFHSETFEF